METSARSLSTYEAVVRETPARRATSAMLTRGFIEGEAVALLALGELAGHLPEVVAALGHVVDQLLAVGRFILDREDRVNSLALHFREHALHVADARAPRRVRDVRARGEVLQVKGDDAAFQLLQAVERHHTGAVPVARVRARPDPLGMTVDRGQHVIRVPVTGRLRMVVQGDVDLVFLA